jgi:hypothetical protein
MKDIYLGKDFDEVSAHRTLRMNGETYLAHVGCHNKQRAEEEAKHFKDRGAKDVKIISVKSYFVCTPASEGSVKVKAKQISKNATKVIRQANKVVHEVAGDLLNRNDRGTQAVRQFMGWGTHRR